MFKRFCNFLLQLFILMPLALIINGCAVAPIIALIAPSGNPVEFSNAVFLLPVMWAAAFFLNKLRLRIKGNKTDDWYNVEKTEKGYEIVDYDKYEKKITIRPYEYTYETEERGSTLLGWIGILLSFIAFPIQLVAVLVSFLAMFFPIFYSTAKKLPPDRDFSILNRVLHFLFDFVIVESHFKRSGKASAWGLLWVLAYLGIAIIGAPLGIISAGMIVQSYPDLLPSINAVGMIGIPTAIFCGLCLVVMIIKYSFLIVLDYSKENGLVYLRKISLLSFVIAIAMFISIMFI